MSADAPPGRWIAEVVQVHKGPVQVRRSSWGITVLCPLGHVVTARADSKDFGGSWFEAAIGDAKNWIVECDGAIAADDNE